MSGFNKIALILLLVIVGYTGYGINYTEIKLSVVALETDTAENNQPEIHDMGVAVSPSHLNFNVEPGKTVTKTITVTNDTHKDYQFSIRFNNFDMSNKGESGMFNEDAKYGLTKWLSASPSFISLAPGQKQKIAVTVEVPEGEQYRHAAWGLMTINQNIERKTLDPGEGAGNTVAMGVIPIFSFGVYVYQNPPGVKNNKVEITNFKLDQKDTLRTINIEAKNIGDGIGFCTSYVELSNLNTGEQTKLLVKRFTILPGHIREFAFPLPNELSKGKYSAIGILDFGSDEEIEAAELEFNIN